MPPKRRKFDSKFPAARIKKIMQLDDDVGRVATPVPIVISRAVEIFLQAILSQSSEYATSRNARTLTVGHLKYCIESEKQWDFLKDLTAKVPDVSAGNENEDSPKRGRKRKNSSSKLSGSNKKSKKTEEEEEKEESEQEEDSDTSSPASVQSNNSQNKRSIEPSPLAVLHKKLATTVPSPLTLPNSSQSPLTALAAKLTPKPPGLSPKPPGLSPKPPGLNPVPNPPPPSSPLLAYASSLPLPIQNLSTYNIPVGVGGASGSHGNSDDEDYDA